MESHSEYKEMLIAHALNALETAEARSIEEHLLECDDCREELAAWHETTAALAFAADATAPSEDLRSQLLQKAAALRKSESPRAQTIDEQSKTSVRNVVPISSVTKRKWNSVQTGSAIAAVIVIALLVVAVVAMWRRNKANEAEVARLSRQVKESQQELARLSEEKRFFTAPNARVTSLSGTEMAKDARAMLAVDHKTGRAMLVANGLPSPPAGMAYQLWFIAKGKPPMPGGVFTTDGAGHAEMRDMIPPEGINANVFAVTLERAGGVTAPEGKMYLQGNVSS